MVREDEKDSEDVFGQNKMINDSKLELVSDVGVDLEGGVECSNGINSGGQLPLVQPHIPPLQVPSIEQTDEISGLTGTGQNLLGFGCPSSAVGVNSSSSGDGSTDGWVDTDDNESYWEGAPVCEHGCP